MSHPPRPACRRPVLGWLPMLVLPLGLLAGCAEAPQQSRSEQALYDACHRMADRVVEHANVDALSQADPTSSPFGVTSVLTNQTSKLSIEHQRQDIMADCLRHYDSTAPNTGVVTATPGAPIVSQPTPPPPADLAGPSGSDLTKPPILTTPAQ
ncbi:MAG TPA: hypothetical protein VL752_12340 [Acidisoma sp.]|uniref:hypothetical protein n=1 Tax=Acidisoma sp. TaxID=1872115 RepID=UPI002CEDCC42|nr:hypothetical protein [Acidisoma sp.]HTI01726.1 hypothetical protein [Acidisoma sp.]